MKNLIIALIVILILAAAIWYVVNAKKRGVKCIGCPEGCTCAGKSGDSCGCKQ